MTTKIYLYQNGDYLAEIIVTGEVSDHAAHLAERGIVPQLTLDPEQYPSTQEMAKYRSAWKLENSTIVLDATLKAKEDLKELDIEVMRIAARTIEDLVTAGGGSNNPRLTELFQLKQALRAQL